MPSSTSKPSYQRFSTSSSSSDDGDNKKREADYNRRHQSSSNRDDCSERRHKRDGKDPKELSDKRCDGIADNENIGKEREKCRQTTDRRRTKESDEAKSSSVVDEGRNSKRHHDEDHGTRDEEKDRDRKRTREYEDDRQEKRMDEGNSRRKSSCDDRRHGDNERRGGYYDYDKKSGSKFRRHENRRSTPPYWKQKRLDRHENSSRPHRHDRERDRDETEEGSGNRPAWATKAVIKRAEEIQQRKLLWTKHDDKKNNEAAATCSSTTSPDQLQSATSSGLATSRPSNATAWSSMLAAAATDSKQIDKFKRLMGIKKTEEGNDEIDVNAVNQEQIEMERQRQQALYSQLDQQYAVARSTTHLSRGQGLGFH